MKSRLLHLTLSLVLQLYTFPAILLGQTFPVNHVVISGETDKRINIVFMSEGYTISEIGQFNQDVQNVITDLFNTTPYAEYESYFNVFAIEVASNESGTDHPGTADDGTCALDPTSRRGHH